MIRDITLGQYYPRESVIHRLDTRTKILATALFVAEAFVVNSFAGFGIIIIGLAATILLSGVPPKFIFKGLKPVMFIILLTFVINLFVFDGTILWQWKFLTITSEGLYRSCFMALRLVLLIIGTSMMTLTSKPMELTDGMEKLLKPLERFGVRSHEIALMMSIALRFIPTLLEETDKIMKAQQARGADFESGNLLERVKNMIPILVPLFVGSFRIAQELALAMEARCYHGGVGRTRMKEIAFGRNDAVAGGILVCFLGIIIASRWLPLP